MIMKNKGISRRKFLQFSGVSTAVIKLPVGLNILSMSGSVAAATEDGYATATTAYGDWRDVYQQRWKWDKITKSSHFTNCWYQSHCAWNVYVKDGLVWREEQVAEYEATNAELPDPNPRGCQKGACFSDRMYDPSRLKYPLKRLGERGSGRWERISWDQAFSEIAESYVDIMVNEGSDRNIIELGPMFTFGTMTAGVMSLSALTDATTIDMNTEIGDGHRGSLETFGKIVFERSADDYFHSDLIFIWGGNPVYTQIPNVHYMLEARYNGATIVVIAPDYSASAVKADIFAKIKPGTDAALALGMANVILKESLYDEVFLVEQTDMPLLVREDTGEFLRSKHLEDGTNDVRSGAFDEFYVVDHDGELAKVPKTTLALGQLKPDMSARREIRLKDGSNVEVRTVFTLLQDKVGEYTPEKASEMCGTPANQIIDLARRMAAAKSACMTTTSNIAKYYHGNLMERAQALVFALCGQYGKKGSGFVAFPFLAFDGATNVIMESADPSGMGRQMMAAGREQLAALGYTKEMIAYESARMQDEAGVATQTHGTMFWYTHAGLLETNEKMHEWDPYLNRPVKEVFEQSLKEGWQHVWPKPGNDPRLMMSIGSNPLRRIRAYPQLLKHLWPKLRTIVDLDFRLTSTGMMSDYVLPVSAWYERDEVKWVTPLMPYLHGGEKATSYYETKSDWEIMSRMIEAVEKEAKAKGYATFKDRAGRQRRFEGIYGVVSGRGKYAHDDDAKLAADIVALSDNVEGDWEDIKKKGFIPFTATGDNAVSIGTQTEFKKGETITPLTNHVFKKVPYPTLTRRMQFYIDQQLYLEFGEQLPTHKDSPKVGGDYPLIITGGHARWSIHSQWRDSRLMLQQQRGEPLIHMNIDDAEKRNIKDGDQVRVYNDMDEFQIMAKVSPAIQPNQTIIYHAWENFQFKDGKGFQNLMPAPLNPVELSGGQFHLRPTTVMASPSHFDRDTRVEVELAS
jgi:DMSO reductase family type II enzyme molybdopterin subunit|tara:strand:- start:13759 stop:16662 length:2904 start_codon:yes stop_codon:yes gene_type:complete